MKNRKLDPRVLLTPPTPSIDRVLARSFWGGPRAVARSVAAQVVSLAHRAGQRADVGRAAPHDDR